MENIKLLDETLDTQVEALVLSDEELHQVQGGIFLGGFGTPFLGTLGTPFLFGTPFLGTGFAGGFGAFGGLGMI